MNYTNIRIIAESNAHGQPEILVVDTGPGIPEEVMDKVFVPFFTIKESGSEIGLSVSRQIMQMHGGSLKIVSKPEIVTRVRL